MEASLKLRNNGPTAVHLPGPRWPSEHRAGQQAFPSHPRGVLNTNVNLRRIGRYLPEAGSAGAAESCSRGAQGQGCSQAGCSPELERRPSGRGLSVGVEPSGRRDAPDILLPAATIHVFAPTCLHPPSNFPSSVTVGPAQCHFCAAQRLPDGLPECRGPEASRSQTSRVPG